jgi:hypothetical protein
VIATADDFNRSGMGGCKLWEAQRMRAERAVTFAVVRAYCSRTVSDAINDYLAEQIWRALRDTGKHRMTFRAVGWADEDRQEIESRYR